MTGGPDASATGSAARALMVLDQVLSFGPVSPTRLTELTGLSRTAVHRAIHALIEQGFVRYQLGKSSVIVTARLRDQFEGAFFSPPGLDTVSRTVEEALRRRRIHCEIAVMTIKGDFAIPESTLPEADHAEDFFDSDLISVLLSHFDPLEVTRITSRTLRDSGAGASVEAEFLDRFRLAQYQAFLWNRAVGTICVRLFSEPEQAVAIRLSPRGGARLRRRDCVEIMEAMATLSPETFPTIATIND